MKLSRHGVFSSLLVLDTTVFLVGSFSANLLTGPLQWSWPAYILFAVLVAFLYGLARWLFSKPDRMRFLTWQTLADQLADSASLYGVDRVYNMQGPNDQVRRNADTLDSIDDAQWMRLAANSGASYLSVGLNRHWPAVRKRLEARTPFKVILLDSFSEEKAVRDRINVAGEQMDFKLPIGDIIRAAQQFPELDVRFAKAGMTCSVFITPSQAYLDPYHLAPDGGRIANRFMCIRMHKAQPPAGLSNYEIVSRHFDTLWNESVPLEQWLQTNGGNLQPLPSLSAKPRGE